MEDEEDAPTKYPLPIEDVERLLDRHNAVEDASGAWKDRPSLIGAHPDFPLTVTYIRPQCAALLGLGEDEQRRVNLLTRGLKIILAPRSVYEYAPRLCIEESTTRMSLVIHVCTVVKSPEFDIECLIAKVPTKAIAASGEMCEDFCIENAQSPLLLEVVTVGGLTWSLGDLTSAVARLGPGPWAFREVRLAEDCRRGEMAINGFGEPIDIEARHAINLEAAERRRALNLLRKAMLPWQRQPKKRPHVVKAKKKVEAAAGKHIEVADVFCGELKLRGGAGDSTDTAHETETDHETDIESGIDAPPPPKPAPPPPKPAPHPPKPDVGGMLDDAPLAMLVAPKAKAGPLVAPKAKAGPLGGAGGRGPARGPSGHRPTFVIENYGHIAIDVDKKQFDAHCYCLGPGSQQAPKDHRTDTQRECRLCRAGAKQPMAFLVQWLRQGHAFDCRVDHRDSQGLITQEERQDCRDWLLEQEDFVELLEREADWSEEGALVTVEKPN